jgi:hypothetical protein
MRLIQRNNQKEKIIQRIKDFFFGIIVLFCIALCFVFNNLVDDLSTGRKFGSVKIFIDNANDEDLLLSYLQEQVASDTSIDINSKSVFNSNDVIDLRIIKEPGYIGHARFWGYGDGSFFGGGIDSLIQNSDGTLYDSIPSTIHSNHIAVKAQFLLADIPSKGNGHIRDLNKAKNLVIPKRSLMSAWIQRGSHFIEIKSKEGLLIERVHIIIPKEMSVNLCYYNISGTNSYRIETGTYTR